MEEITFRIFASSRSFIGVQFHHFDGMIRIETWMECLRFETSKFVVPFGFEMKGIDEKDSRRFFDYTFIMDLYKLTLWDR